jgi:hypothetical protein
VNLTNLTIFVPFKPTADFAESLPLAAAAATSEG